MLGLVLILLTNINVRNSIDFLLIVNHNKLFGDDDQLVSTISFSSLVLQLGFPTPVKTTGAVKRKNLVE